jgi:hypothetical protein
MRTGIAVVLAVGCLSLAACSGSSGGPDPSFSFSPAPSFPTRSSPAASSGPDSRTVAQSPTGTSPVLTGAGVKPGEKPPIFDRRFLTHDQGGAIAFTSYFYRALDWSIATTNANLLRPMSAPTCSPISNLELRRQHHRHHHRTQPTLPRQRLLQHPHLPRLVRPHLHPHRHHHPHRNDHLDRPLQHRQRPIPTNPRHRHHHTPNHRPTHPTITRHPRPQHQISEQPTPPSPDCRER